MDFNLEQRMDWIIEYTRGFEKVVVGASGGKDSSVVLALCVKALGAERVIAVTMPCSSNPTDAEHAKLVSDAFGVELITVDLKDTFDTLKNTIGSATTLSDLGIANIKPRLRMTTLYAIAQANNALVVGTDNLSEMVMGYFTKWGDGGYDINPLSDLTVSEVLAFGKVLGVPAPILEKPPSAGLWEGQTDENEMGVTYDEVEEFIKTGATNERAQQIIERANKISKHKREMPYCFSSK
ncbi:MAG: NAD(+) synthase [Epulopiscium sp. Nele67-Bin004]|nr:MAG: NAD(+) synthase [Epulopiscium sp. Nele67-Bin004]